jgi:hypothetical protein
MRGGRHGRPGRPLPGDTAAMRWLARLLLLRVLPRRLLPILTVWEVWKIVRGRQAARDQAARAAAMRRAGTYPTPGPATRRPTR